MNNITFRRIHKRSITVIRWTGIVRTLRPRATVLKITDYYNGSIDFIRWNLTPKRKKYQISTWGHMTNLLNVFFEQNSKLYKIQPSIYNKKNFYRAPVIRASFRGHMTQRIPPKNPIHFYVELYTVPVFGLLENI